jgi:hypothetical protein
VYIYHENRPLQYVQILHGGVYLTSSGAVVEPQPTEEKLLAVRRHYATSSSGDFKRVITYVHDIKDAQLSILKTKALVQYIGKESHAYFCRLQI